METKVVYNELKNVNSSDVYNQLPEYTRIAKYAQYNSSAKRRETWPEQVERVFKMHKVKFAEYLEDEKFMEQFNFAKQMMVEKKVLGSQRALQFGGPSVLNKNTRIYNCAATYINRVEVFSQIMFTLMAGAGVGFSVQTHHISQLPCIKSPSSDKMTYVIPDSIEGWSDSIGVLLSSYFVSDSTFPEYSGKTVVFDFSLIRPKGSAISHVTGKAPGPDGLRESLEKIRSLLDFTVSFSDRLRPIDAYDIIMHLSDAVLSGGVRRSATLCMFSVDDTEMMNAKTGDWFIKNPQRGRSNNSAVLLRNSTSEEKYMSIIESVKQFGEPGFIWTDDTECLYNPCLTKDTWVMTKTGPRQIEDLIKTPFTAIVNGEEYNCNTGFVCTGSRPVYRIETSEGFEVCATSNHKFLTTNGWKTVESLRDGDSIIMNKHLDYNWEGETAVGYDFENFNNNIEYSSSNFYRKFLGDLFREDDNLFLEDITSLKFIQRMLLRIGQYSFISGNRLILNNNADFVGTVSAKVNIGLRDVYDCTVEDIHAFDANGFYSHNCVEIGLYSYNEKMQSGMSFCNLSEINMKTVVSKDDFFERCRAASILGTLQAAYTDFGYLGKVTQEIVEKEALIGVSMTGMMECPEISFDPETLQHGAQIVKDTNKLIASMIHINQAARTTCVKPAGTSSCILGTSSGIHPSHSRRYFRRVQANQLEEHLRFFKSINPSSVTRSVWTKTDDSITFLCKTNKNAIVKSDLTAVEFLDKVKLVQQNWVMPGKNDHLCVQGYLNHNVSNTVTVGQNEWTDTAKFIYANRAYFSGISLLSSSGDLTYQQAPFQEVLTHEEIAKKYGAGSLFASGLIVHAHNAFDGNLYSACDCLLGFGEKLDTPKFDIQSSESFSSANKLFLKIQWVAQARKFAHRHFNDDLVKMTECLKLVDAWKNWCDLKRTYNNVDWSKFYEEKDNTNPTQYVACSGNSCEVITF